MANQLVMYDDELPAYEVRSQVNQIQTLMKLVLQEGEHYGKIPGVQKPTLLQPGAEKICLMFHLVPHYEIVKESIDGMPGHREYTVTCSLYDSDGVKRSEAVASCSTMESRYRWRDGWEDTGEPIPRDARDRKQEYRKKGFGMKKVNGNWIWVRFLDRQENADIADQWNTVCQMAQKRAFVRAVRSATAASDIFTQDIEEVPYVESTYEVPEQESPKPAEPPKPSMTDDERAELANLVDTMVRANYDATSSKREIWERYKNGGIDGARAYVSSAVASATGDVEIEDSEIDF